MNTKKSEIVEEADKRTSQEVAEAALDAGDKILNLALPEPYENYLEDLAKKGTIFKSPYIYCGKRFYYYHKKSISNLVFHTKKLLETFWRRKEEAYFI
ncbi:MAG: hypothetical protein MGF17_08870 [Trichodesmium sp. MAG_R04]|jgi:hypothetical protein|nr:hypothetical protein [Trichodesmium sp. MAG_R04]